MKANIYTWEEKKRQGDLFERFAQRNIKYKKYSSAIIDNPNKKFEHWDIYINEDIKIECKHDIEAAFTGNICIEFSQDGRDSGIRTTKAKYYLICDGIYDGKTMYLIYVDKIKELINVLYENKLKRFVNGENEPDETLNFNGIIKQEIYPLRQNDTYTKYMGWYLIPKHIFSEYCLEVRNIFKMTYSDMI